MIRHFRHAWFGLDIGGEPEPAATLAGLLHEALIEEPAPAGPADATRPPLRLDGARDLPPPPADAITESAFGVDRACADGRVWSGMPGSTP